MSENKIKAEARTEFGKGAARRIRREDKVPAVLYGHGADPVHLTLPGHDLMMALKQSNALLSIEVEGGESHLALPKQVQRDPIKGFIEHADLLIVRKGEKVTVEVPVHVVGEAVSGSLVVTEHASIAIEAEATHLPEFVEASIAGLDVGSQVHASDIALPKGSTLAIDPDTLVVNVVAAPTADQVEAELEQAESEAGIERDESATEVASDEAAAPAE
ncbi:large subunit ribosomal protein L25 [Mumia flava]|uniref:Large ribosomal subunit protein bL25 n=1 Tax=Mumia flava TaxID=1348852 RepID=A0A0B2B228_9ACTN|nr:50S ribosomal protein L25/general stress protein Ctc [Mumia flava]PJJ56875.1 large subunit ribosomal protein L25 [Mumia flava]